MKPYCGWLKALRNDGIRHCRTLGPCPSWHRPNGIVRIEFNATMRALKRAERQRARREIIEQLLEVLSDQIIED